MVDARHALRKGEKFEVKVWYDGVPEPGPDGSGGFVPTDDGFTIAGQPHVASTWFPVNDHPSDAASYTFHVTVPKHLEVVANGDLVDKDRHGRVTTWTWKAVDPMASYLTTVDVGQFDLDFYRDGGIRYVDAIDPDLHEPLGVPTDGDQLAIAQKRTRRYKRLQHVIDVPAGGGTVAFTMARGTETTGTSSSSRRTRSARTTGRRWRT